MARLIEQLHGLDQGCPLSPAFFAITLAPGLDDIARYAQSLDAQSWVYAYLDDIYLVLPRAFVPQVLARTKAMLSQLGLELNEHKTKVWFPGRSHRTCRPGLLNTSRRLFPAWAVQ